MFRRISLAALILALTAGPALAGKPGSGGGVTGSIELASPARTAEAGAWPRYGDSVAFSTSVEGRLAPHSRVYVLVVCLQGDKVVYQWSGDRDFAFPLSDQEGQGLEWDGGAASCSATLVYFVDRHEDEITYLDSTTFDAAAA